MYFLSRSLLRLLMLSTLRLRRLRLRRGARGGAGGGVGEELEHHRGLGARGHERRRRSLRRGSLRRRRSRRKRCTLPLLLPGPLSCWCSGSRSSNRGPRGPPCCGSSAAFAREDGTHHSLVERLPPFAERFQPLRRGAALCGGLAEE